MEWPQEDGIIGYYPLSAITLNVFLFLMQIVIDITSPLYMLLHFRYVNEISRSFIFIKSMRAAAQSTEWHLSVEYVRDRESSPQWQNDAKNWVKTPK